MIYKDTYRDYINNVDSFNLHNEIKFLYKSDINNIIIYGPSGSGKYSQALKYLEQFSPSKLKYEKKLFICTSKQDYTIKISDIHYEIDFEQLGCNAKFLFNEIYNNIIENIYVISKTNTGFILCKNFHNIDNELLDIFYSYMQKIINNKIILKYILLTDSISFINNNIIKISNIINLKYPKLNKINTKYKDTDNVECNNINIVKYNVSEITITKNFYKICDELLVEIISQKYDIINIRNLLYNLLIYNINIYNSFYYIIKSLILSKHIKNLDSEFLYITGNFCTTYNNNYRPIFHLEKYILYLIKLVNEL